MMVVDQLEGHDVVEKPPLKPAERGAPADKEPMHPRRAFPAIAAGVLALVCAVIAIATDTGWLVIVAGSLALVSAAIVVDWHRHLQAAQAARAEAEAKAAAEAAHLMAENDEALARAARFEAEAIRARAELAEAMSMPNRRATDAIDLSSGAPPVGRKATGEAVVDETTGLFTNVFFDASLRKRVSAARRGLRPLSVAVADIVTGVGTPDLTRADATKVAANMLEVFREADTLARASDGLYLILLEDTPENGAIWTLERLRRRIAEDMPGHTLWVGVSCYPAFGFDADQLLSQARGALDAAREWQQDRIEVTTASPD